MVNVQHELYTKGYIGQVALPMKWSRSVSGIPLVRAMANIEQAFEVKRAVNEFFASSTVPAKSFTAETVSDDLVTANTKVRGAAVELYPSHSMEDTDTTLKEISSSMQATTGREEMGLDYIASSLPVTDEMIQEAPTLDGTERVYTVENKHASRHKNGWCEGLNARPTRQIFGQSVVNSGFATNKVINRMVRGVLTPTAIGPDNGVSYKAFKEPVSAIATFARYSMYAPKGQRPDMDIATPICFLQPLGMYGDLHGCVFNLEYHDEISIWENSIA